MVGIGKSVAGASDGVMPNTFKPFTNAQTVRGRPTPNDHNKRAFRKQSFCELAGNISMLQTSALFSASFIRPRPFPSLRS